MSWQVCTIGGDHFGRNKTVEEVSSRLFWINVGMDVRHYVSTCDHRQHTNLKQLKQSARLHPIAVNPEFGHHVGINLIGPLKMSRRGNQYIVTCTAYFQSGLRLCGLFIY